jgi:hypothetical protein
MFPPVTFLARVFSFPSTHLASCRPTGSCPETGFETISLQLNDHTDRGVGGRQYGASEDIETLQGKNNASTSRSRAVEEFGPSLARRSQLARIIRSCHRRIYQVVCSEPRLSFNRTVVLRYRFFLEQKNLAPSTEAAV